MGWIIDQDHIGDKDKRKGTNANAVGVLGPQDYKGDGSELKHRFRIYDSDNVLYYEGRCSSKSHAPLDDFGKPNAGATSIRYLRIVTAGRAYELASELRELMSTTPAIVDNDELLHKLSRFAADMMMDWVEL